MKFHLYKQPTFVKLPKGATVQDLRTLAHFNRIIKNYEKMKRIEQNDLSYTEGLKEAAEKCEAYYDVGEEHGYLCTHRGDIKDAFIAGAEWQKAKMMEEAVEGEVLYTPYPTICLDDCRDYDMKDRSNVHVIIIREEEK